MSGKKGTSGPEFEYIEKFRKKYDISRDNRHYSKMENVYVLDKTKAHETDFSILEINGMKYVRISDSDTKWYIFGKENNNEIIMEKIRNPRDITTLNRALKKSIDDKIILNELFTDGLIELIKESKEDKKVKTSLRR